MPGQNTMSRALRLHLSAPRCDECMSLSMDERIEEGTMTLLPLKKDAMIVCDLVTEIPKWSCSS